MASPGFRGGGPPLYTMCKKTSDLAEDGFPYSGEKLVSITEHWATTFTKTLAEHQAYSSTASTPECPTLSFLPPEDESSASRFFKKLHTFLLFYSYLFHHFRSSLLVFQLPHQPFMLLRLFSKCSKAAAIDHPASGPGKRKSWINQTFKTISSSLPKSRFD